MRSRGSVQRTHIITNTRSQPLRMKTTTLMTFPNQPSLSLRDRKSVVASDLHLIDAQPRQRPAHPHHHEHQEPALEDEDDYVNDVPEPAELVAQRSEERRGFRSSPDRCAAAAASSAPTSSRTPGASP